MLPVESRRVGSSLRGRQAGHGTEELPRLGPVRERVSAPRSCCSDGSAVTAPRSRGGVGLGPSLGNGFHFLIEDVKREISALQC